MMTKPSQKARRSLLPSFVRPLVLGTVAAVATIPACHGATTTRDGVVDGSMAHMRSYRDGPDLTLVGDPARTAPIPADLPVPEDTIVPDDGSRPPLGTAALSVSDSGDARYHIPIWVPEGRAGVQPELALDYSSGAGNGPLGVGWQLRGLARITRCRNLPTAGVTPSPLSFDTHDSFCINGSPLVPVPDQPNTYRTFDDSFARIVAYDFDEEGPERFEERTKDGRIFTFGQTEDSLIDGQRAVIVGDPQDYGTNATYTFVRYGWGISQIRDRPGNTMTIRYLPNSGGDIMPFEIDYTSASDAQALRKVVFEYDYARADIDDFYLSGLEIRRPERLFQIRVFGPNPVTPALLRTTTLTYETSATTQRSLLHQVSECDAIPTTPATTSPPMCRQVSLSYTGALAAFDFHDTGMTDLATQSQHPNSVTPPVITVLDVNGDGMDDILYRSSTAADGTYHLRLSTGTGLGSDTDTGIPVARDVYPYASGPYPADFNGDGHTDALVDVGSKNFPGNAIYLATLVGNAWKLVPAPGVLAVGARVVQAADLNGDRLPDIVVSDGTSGKAGFVLNKNGVVDPSTIPTDFGHAVVPPFLYVDVNGDGRSDLLGATPFDVKSAQCPSPTDLAFERWAAIDVGPAMGTPMAAGTTSWQPTTLIAGSIAYLCTSNDNPWPFSGGVDVPLFADYNGDGLTDVVLGGYPPPLLERAFGNPGDQLFVTLNSGHGFPTPTLVNSVAFTSSTFQTMDWNLDGKTDLIQRRPDQANPLVAYTYKSGDFAQTSLPILDGVAKDKRDLNQFAILDANGDGLQDILMLSGGRVGLYTRRGPKPDLLNATSGNFGPATALSYQVANQPETNPEDCHIPVHCTAGRVWVVETTTVDNGLGATNVSHHTFQDGRLDVSAWGFLGFKIHSWTDSATGGATTRTFDLSSRPGPTPFYPLVGQPTSEVTKTPFLTLHAPLTPSKTPPPTVSVTRIATKTTAYSVTGLGPYRAMPTTITETSVDAFAGGTVEPVATHITTQSFDGYGNLLLQTQSWPLDHVTQTKQITYQLNLPEWLVSLPLLETDTSTSATESSTRQTGYEFDANGLLLRKTENPGSGPFPKPPPTQKPPPPPKNAQPPALFPPLPPQADGVQTRYTEYERDAHGMPTQVVVEDALTGPAQQRISKTSYDALEGMFAVTTVDPANHTTGQTFHPGLSVVARRTDENGLTTNYQYDTFGRIRAERPPTGDKRTVAYRVATKGVPFGSDEDQRLGSPDVVRELDSLGRTTVTSQAYRADGKVVWNTTAYDAQGHVVRQSRPYFEGATRSYVTNSYDGLGRLVSTSYPDGSSLRNWYSGETVQTLDTSGDASVTQYDTSGRPVSHAQRLAFLPTPHVVTTTLAYGPFGQLERITDTMGNVLQMTYDRRSRLHFKLDPDQGAQKLVYDVFDDVVATTRGGTWSGSDVAGGTLVTTSYDGDGRVTSIVAPHETLTTQWDTAAHGIGKVASSQRSSSGASLVYTYDTNARLSQQTWSTPQGTTGSFGYGYDAFNRPSTLAYPQTPGRAPLVVQNTYSPGGQLTSVGDTASGVVFWTLESSDASETFTTEKLGNALESTSTEDSQHPGWLSTLISTTPSGTVRNLQYNRDGHGRLRGRSDAESGTTESFKYDGLSRLTTWAWSRPGEARNVVYSYDDIGDLLSKTVTAGPGASVSLGYDPSHFGPHQPATVNTQPCAYDAHGNQTSALGRNFTYDDFDRIASATTSSGTYTFAYDAEMNRGLRTDPTGATIQSFGPLYEVRTLPDGNHHVATIAAKGPVAQIETIESKGTVSSETTTYLSVDVQGSVDTISDSSGNVVTRLAYEPFGGRVVPSDSSQPVTSTPNDVRIGYAGQEHDDELALINMTARMYDPIQQRFFTEDSVAPKPVDSQGLNPYAYAHNDPLDRTDPSGHQDISDPSQGFDDGTSSFATAPSQNYSSPSQSVDSPQSFAPLASSFADPYTAPDFSSPSSVNQSLGASQGIGGTSGPYSADDATSSTAQATYSPVYSQTDIVSQTHQSSFSTYFDTLQPITVPEPDVLIAGIPNWRTAFVEVGAVLGGKYLAMGNYLDGTGFRDQVAGFLSQFFTVDTEVAVLGGLRRYDIALYNAASEIIGFVEVKWGGAFDTYFTPNNTQLIFDQMFEGPSGIPVYVVGPQFLPFVEDF